MSGIKIKESERAAATEWVRNLLADADHGDDDSLSVEFVGTDCDGDRASTEYSEQYPDYLTEDVKLERVYPVPAGSDRYVSAADVEKIAKNPKYILKLSGEIVEEDGYRYSPIFFTEEQLRAIVIRGGSEHISMEPEGLGYTVRWDGDTLRIGCQYRTLAQWAQMGRDLIERNFGAIVRPSQPKPIPENCPHGPTCVACEAIRRENGAGGQARSFWMYVRLRALLTILKNEPPMLVSDAVGVTAKFQKKIEKELARLNK